MDFETAKAEDLSLEYCSEKNKKSTSGICVTPYVGLGHISIMQFYHESVDADAALERLNKLFDGYDLKKDGWELPWSYKKKLATSEESFNI